MHCDAATDVDFQTLWLWSPRRGAVCRGAPDILSPSSRATYGGIYPAATTIKITLHDTAAQKTGQIANAQIVLSPAAYLLSKLNAIWAEADSEEAPSEKAKEDARAFIENSALNAIPLPRISAAEDGEINFHWDSTGVHIDLGFYGTGTFSYYARDKQGRRYHGEPTPASGGFPKELEAIFAA